MEVYAVITGDVIHSTKLPAEQRQWLFSEIQKNLKGWNKDFKMKSETFRGDSFQSLLLPTAALRMALIQKTFIRSLSLVDVVDPKQAARGKARKMLFPKVLYDARMAIGIGPIENNTKSLASAGGTAFELSGQLLDSMKGRKQSLAIATNDGYQDELATECTLLDALLSKTTPAQCEVIRYKLMGFTELHIAEDLEIAQSAVNQRSNGGAWNAIDTMLRRFEKIYES